MESGYTHAELGGLSPGVLVRFDVRACVSASLQDFERAVQAMKDQDVPGPYRFVVHPSSPYASMLAAAGYKVDVDYECQASVAYVLSAND